MHVGLNAVAREWERKPRSGAQDSTLQQAGYARNRAGGCGRSAFRRTVCQRALVHDDSGCCSGSRRSSV